MVAAGTLYACIRKVLCSNTGRAIVKLRCPSVYSGKPHLRFEFFTNQHTSWTDRNICICDDKVWMSDGGNSAVMSGQIKSPSISLSRPNREFHYVIFNFNSLSVLNLVLMKSDIYY
jgi:hypothetical protein